MAADREALTRQVKEANDIADVVGAYVTLHPSGPVFKALCPFHDDRRPSLDVDPRRQRYRCWACGEKGDVFTFVMKMDKVDFLQAREILARRAGIPLEGDARPNPARARLLETVRWAAEQYQTCLLDDPLAEGARRYLGERGLTGATVRAFGLGYAPLAGDWLAARARRAGIPAESLVEAGLIAPRMQGEGFYDRFRDRVMFPIRDLRGQPIAFGGRILPSSPYAARAPKYYNSTETPLFNKGEVLYGLDQARQAGASAGYLAVVEGYTDVLMAHQCGVAQVVATMGTALTPRHVALLRRSAPRVVLVFDADAGGATGVDRALQLFVSQDVELAIATLPEGLDPCDFLLREGGGAFRKLLEGAADALDFKLGRLLAKEEGRGVEGVKRVVDGILGILAGAPDLPGQAGQLKREAVVTRLTKRLGLRQETVWARLGELAAQRRRREARHPSAAPPGTAGLGGDGAAAPAPPAAPAPRLERQLLEVLLAEPALVPEAAARITPERLTHPGLRRLLECLFELHRAGEPPDLDAARARLNHPALAAKALELQEVGASIQNRPAWLQRILQEFEQRQTARRAEQLRGQLSRVTDHETAVELLRRLQSPPDRPVGSSR